METTIWGFGGSGREFSGCRGALLCGFGFRIFKFRDLVENLSLGVQWISAELEISFGLVTYFAVGEEADLNQRPELTTKQRMHEFQAARIVF